MIRGLQKGFDQGIDQGIDLGVDQTRIENVHGLMQTMKWTAQQAMDALMIPKNEQQKYLAKL